MVSLPEMAEGQTVKIYLGGSHSGTAKDGVQWRRFTAAVQKAMRPGSGLRQRRGKAAASAADSGSGAGQSAGQGGRDRGETRRGSR